MAIGDAGRWELRLGLTQLVMLLGILSGLMVCVFFIGYFAGVNVGHNTALQASLANTVKLPIPVKELDQDSAAGDAAQVYAKLQENRANERQRDSKDDDMPSLGSIESVEQAPVGAPKDLVVAMNDGDEELHQEAEKAAAKTENLKKQMRAVLGEALEAGDEHPVKEIDQLLKKPEQRAEDLQKTKPIEKEDSLDDALAASEAELLNEQADKLPPPPKKKELPAVVAKAPVVPTATPKPEVKVDTAPAKKPVIAAPGKGWYAQVAAPKKKEDADQLSAKLRQSGFAVSIEVASVRGDNYYRVLVGPEDSKTHAQALVGQLKREKFVQSDPFIKFVK